MARGDEKHRQVVREAVRQGDAPPEILVARIVEQQVRPLLRRIAELEQQVATLQASNNAAAGSSQVYFDTGWPADATAPALLVKYLPDGTFDDFEVM